MEHFGVDFIYLWNRNEGAMERDIVKTKIEKKNQEYLSGILSWEIGEGRRKL